MNFIRRFFLFLRSMRIAIVEDELLAVNYLQNILQQQTIVAIDELVVLRSKSEAIQYFIHNHVDLIFMDIHLGDGKSLEIFEEVEIKSPIIFVTTFDEYAIKVFKHFTIDYILKPYEEEELHHALKKFQTIQETFNTSSVLHSLVSIENNIKADKLNKLLVTNGQKIIVLNDDEIAYFFASGKHLFVRTNDGRTYIYDDTLKEINHKLNSDCFFKVNRKYIIHRNCIQEIIKHSSQKVEITVNPTPEIKSEILISKPQIGEFIHWISENN